MGGIMEVRKRKRYSKEFKEDVVNMIKTGNKTIPAIAKELEIHEQLIYGWYKKLNPCKDDEIKEETDKDKEIRLLRKRLAEVEEERDILKKAVNIFSRAEKL